MQSLGFNALGRRTKLACTTLVLCSLLLVVLIPIPEAAQAQSCPPPWMSCTSWQEVPEACCCCIFVFYEGTHYRRQCTWWDYDVNNYPTCTYKVVHQEWQFQCKSPLCQN